MEVELDENDRSYPVTKWGMDYHTKKEYWAWFHQREARARTRREAQFAIVETLVPESETAPLPKSGW